MQCCSPRSRGWCGRAAGSSPKELPQVERVCSAWTASTSRLFARYSTCAVVHRRCPPVVQPAACQNLIEDGAVSEYGTYGGTRSARLFFMAEDENPSSLPGTTGASWTGAALWSIGNVRRLSALRSRLLVRLRERWGTRPAGMWRSRSAESTNKRTAVPSCGTRSLRPDFTPPSARGEDDRAIGVRPGRRT